MSLDFSLHDGDTCVFDINTTHNHATIARAIEPFLHYALWNPRSQMKAVHIIPLVASALVEIDRNRENYRQLDPPNGWGSVECFEVFLRQVLAACVRFPQSKARSCV